jgi:mannose-1-phosphate guanylyltransferase / phosphomannomutase
MTTVLFADRDGAAFGPLGTRIVPALLPLAGVPVLEHALEALVGAGRRSALLVVGPRAPEIERRFGKGIRWGIALEIVRREDGETTGDVLRRLEPRLDGETVVVRGDVGVHAALGEFLRKAEDARGPIVAGLLGGRPAGLWRLLPGALKKKDFPREPGASEWTADTDHAAVSLTEGPILLTDVAAYYRADRAAAGASVAPGSAPAISDRATVDGTAVLQAGTTVAEEAVVLSQARLSAVSVLPRTAIPPGLALENAVVSGNLVVDASTGATSLLTDRLPAAGKGSPSSSNRGLGLVALVLSFPLWPVAAIWSAIANAGHSTRPVTLSGNAREGGGGRAAFPTFQFETAVPVLRDLPLLFAVVAGRLALSGVTPLTPAEEAGLREPWEKVRNEAPVGVLSLARLAAPASAPPEVARLVDSFWARTRTPLLGRALSALFSARAWTASRAWNPDMLREEEKP